MAAGGYVCIFIFIFLDRVFVLEKFFDILHILTGKESSTFEEYFQKKNTQSLLTPLDPHTHTSSYYYSV